MGKTITPTFIVKTVEEKAYTTPMAWHCKKYGSPTNKRLFVFIKELEASACPGGVNEHLGSLNIVSAKIIRQETGEAVAVYHRALSTI